MTTVKLCVDLSRMVYVPTGRSVMSLSFSTLCSSSLWRTDTIVFSKLNKPPSLLSSPPPSNGLEVNKPPMGRNRGFAVMEEAERKEMGTWNTGYGRVGPLFKTEKELEFQIALRTYSSPCPRQVLVWWAENLPGLLSIRQVRLKSDLPSRKFYLFKTTGWHFFEPCLPPSPPPTISACIFPTMISKHIISGFHEKNVICYRQLQTR